MFARVEKHQRGKNKPKGNKDDQGWRRLTRIVNDELENFRLNFSRCLNRNVAPLKELCHGLQAHLTKWVGGGGGGTGGRDRGVKTSHFPYPVLPPPISLCPSVS